MTIIITPEPVAAVTDDTEQPATAPAPRISPFRHTGSLPTPAFERAVEAQLSHHRRGGRPLDEPRRAAISVLASALRGGNPLTQVLNVARGLTASELAAAYDTIDRARCDSVDAWTELRAERTPEAFDRVGARLERLFPALVSSLRGVAHDPQRFAQRVDEYARRSDDLAIEVADIEAQVDHEPNRGRSLLAVLDNGHNAGLYHESAYCPQRVGDIVPTRLASLLDASDAEVA